MANNTSLAKSGRYPISTKLLERLLQAPEWAAKGWVTS